MIRARPLLLGAALAASLACAPARGASAPPTGPPATPTVQAASEPAPTPAGAPSRPGVGRIDEGLFISTAGWKTDFSKRTVPLRELAPGGPPRDGIPPIDRPQLVGPAEAGAWLRDNEPVVALEVAGEARAYPLQILIWHEIANDVVGGVPVAVTFCPLCNTAIAFDRRVDGAGTLRFGTTGNLRHSDLVMWSDDPGETWWQQITGEAIVGALAGTRLTPLPAQIVSFADFRAAHPAGRGLGRETGHSRPYGSNPYVGYDDITGSPFLFSGPTDDRRLPPMERVVAAELDGEMAAYPFRELLKVHVVNDTLGGRPIVVLHRVGTASALDAASIPASRDVGAAGVFERTVDGRALSFQSAADGFRDAEMGSSWDITGRATAGPLAGRRLTPVVHDTRFWFVAAVVRPNLRLWAP